MPKNKIGPSKFYALVDVVMSLSVHEELLKDIENTFHEVTKDLEGFVQVFDRASKHFIHQESFSKKRNPLASLEKESNNGPISTSNFLDVGLGVSYLLHSGFLGLTSIIEMLHPEELLLSENRYKKLRSAEDIQQLMFEIQLNSHTVNQVYTALLSLNEIDHKIMSLIKEMQVILETYYRRLVHRHTVEGICVIKNPIITDIALSVFNNIDNHGEIEDGKDPNEISAYSIGKAQAVIRAIKDKDVMMLVQEPDRLVNFIIGGITTLYRSAHEMQVNLRRQIGLVKNIMGKKDPVQINSREIEYQINSLRDLNPGEIQYKSREGLQTREEKFVLKFSNETIEYVVKELLNENIKEEQVVTHILERKAELRKFFHDENSFYVCKIGNGNSFTGMAPGALEVIPGQRPLTNLDEILGSGFEEVKEFLLAIEMTAKWHDLFLATSPSKTADKANVLLIGPQGCGKSEILRAVGSDKSSLGIFAQGSDFLTCWKGEAEKNPKRLFEAGLKLSKESKKRVHFLIDEVDAVLNNDHALLTGGTNLTLEFQILMDGVVQYPNLSVWGATNSPNRIPTPMLRRFNKVLIVGELGQSERVELLKHFISGFLPVNGVTDQLWEEAAQKLKGAVGDIVRKVADHIWRQKMTQFVRTNKEQAHQLLDSLHKNGEFQLADFNSEARSSFKEKLGNHVKVTADDVMQSIDMHLRNMAIRKEIEVCVETYKQAHELIDSLSQN